MSARWLGRTHNAESGILRKTTKTTTHTADPHLDDLLVFGYACKIFRDNERASEIDHGKHLIPWMGDHSLKIDRYDVRATLSDIRPYEAPPGGYPDRMAFLTAAEQRAEQLCEEERYFSLYHNDVEEEMYQDEELKRLHKARSSTYGNVAFNYDSLQSTSTKEDGAAADESYAETADEPFVSNPRFYVPPDIEPPETMKLHAVIEKTAKFIASQGPQMEILIKAKQSNNRQFEFLNLNNHLNPYYKHLLNAVKHGFYPSDEPECSAAATASVSEKAQTEMQTTPAMEADVPVVVVPQLKYKPSADCSYTQLISKIKGVPIPTDKEQPDATEVPSNDNTTFKQISDYRNMLNKQPALPSVASRNTSSPLLATPSLSTPESINNPTVQLLHSDSPKVEVKKISSGLMLAQCYNSESEDDNPDEQQPTQVQLGKNTPQQVAVVLDMPVPPEELQNIIDKTAAYVLKNGKEFEEILRTKGDPRFSFLTYTDQYYRYYIYKVTGALPTLPKPPSQEPARNSNVLSSTPKPHILANPNDSVEVKHNTIASVSFSIKSKDEPAPRPLKPVLPLEGSSSDDDSDVNLYSNKKQSTSTIPTANTDPASGSTIATNNSPALLPTPPVAPSVASPSFPQNASRCIESNGRSGPNLDVSDSVIRDAMLEATDSEKDRQAERALAKEKHLQLERRRKAMAFLNQIHTPTLVVSTCRPEIETKRRQDVVMVAEEEEDQPITIGSHGSDRSGSVHSVHSSPESRPKPLVVLNGGVVSDDDDDDDDDDYRRTYKRSRSRCRSRTTSNSSRNHKRKKSKHHRHAKKSKSSSHRSTRSRSRSARRSHSRTPNAAEQRSSRRRRHARSRSRSRKNSSRCSSPPSASTSSHRTVTIVKLRRQRD